MAEIASLRGISKVFSNGIKALENLSLELQLGESVALLGPNGAGKTTTIKILTGLLRPNSGEVWVKGNRFYPGDFSQRLFGVALQELGLWPHLTAFETLTFVAKLYGFDSKTSRSKGEEILEALDLKGHRSISMGELSEGLKRRLNLACALIHNPEIVILDEPSLGLDVHARLSLWKFLEQLLSTKKITLLLTTHDMEEADRLCQRIAVLDKGKLLAFDTSHALRAKYGAGDEITFVIASSPTLSAESFANVPGFISFHQVADKTRAIFHDATFNMGKLLHLLEAKGLKIEEVQIRPNTLEQVFLNLTGRPLN